MRRGAHRARKSVKEGSITDLIDRVQPRVDRCELALGLLALGELGCFDRVRVPIRRDEGLGKVPQPLLEQRGGGVRGGRRHPVVARIEGLAHRNDLVSSVRYAEDALRPQPCGESSERRE